jgi:hypothetical protein
MLVSEIRSPIADTSVQPLVIVIIKVLGDAGLGAGQVGKKRPLADFKGLTFAGATRGLQLVHYRSSRRGNSASAAPRGRGAVTGRHCCSTVHLGQRVRAGLMWASGPRNRDVRHW